MGLVSLRVKKANYEIAFLSFFKFITQILLPFIFFFPLAMVVLSNLEPNTTYEIKVAAVNGKGQGEYSKIEIFQTLPVRE